MRVCSKELILSLRLIYKFSSSFIRRRERNRWMDKKQVRLEVQKFAKRRIASPKFKLVKNITLENGSVLVSKVGFSRISWTYELSISLTSSIWANLFKGTIDQSHHKNFYRLILIIKTMEINQFNNEFLKTLIIASVLIISSLIFTKLINHKFKKREIERKNKNWQNFILLNGSKSNKKILQKYSN